MSLPAAQGLQVHLSRDFGGFSLSVDLHLPPQGVTVIFGPSGSGKSTLLRCIAGLEPEARGRVSLNGQVWQDDHTRRFLPVHRRPIGYVFQDAALFPHLTVRANLEYGQKRVPPEQRRIAHDQAVDLLGIRPLLERYPARLSGGEQQRVGMARALLTSPRLLLMDEPLAALDLPLKREILPYLERLHAELNIPVLYVTHSPEEMTRLGDHLVMLAAGRVRGQGALAAMLSNLEHLPDFADDPGVVLEASVAEHDASDGITRLDFAGGRLWVSLKPHPIGARVRCRILPTDVSLSLTRARDTSILNILPATVVAIAEASDPTQRLVQLDVEGSPLLSRITRRSQTRLDLRPGLSLYAQIKAVAFLE